MPDVLDVSMYAREYGLERNILGIKEVEAGLDVNQPGLVMHGSEKDPLTILRYGLVPQKTLQNPIDGQWQVCLGLSSDDDTTLYKNLARKNSAVKYAGYFSGAGIVYVLDDGVKLLDGYREYWDEGEGSRGYAWVSHPISADMITALITKNLSLAAAAVLAAAPEKHVYTPDGTCYRVEQL